MFKRGISPTLTASRLQASALTLVVEMYLEALYYMSIEDRSPA